MRNEYEFSAARRGALLPTKGKTRITIYIDSVVLEEFRARAERAGTGYQTMINEILRDHLAMAETTEDPLTESVLRRVLREELPASKKRPSRPTRGRQPAASLG